MIENYDVRYWRMSAVYSTARNTWWRHQLETFAALLTICAGNSPATGEFPDIGQWRRALMSSSICSWINGWVNDGVAGDSRRYRAHYDVTAMRCPCLMFWCALLWFVIGRVYAQASGVWCRGLTTRLLHVGPPFGNRILNNSWAVGLTLWIIYFTIFVFWHMQ